MLNQSKMQVSLVVMLGLMMIGHVGFMLYKNVSPSVLSQTTFKKNQAHAGFAKAFGLTGAYEKHFHVASVKELDHVFNDSNYTLANAKKNQQVPRLYLAKLPRDMKQKKHSGNPTFIQVLLPHILKVNEQILGDRARLLEMQNRQRQGHHLRHAEKLWLSKLASEYRCKSTKIESLLVHVDIVPPSLALAQGILETGGGVSFAARIKNSPFGYMATKTKVKSFDSLYRAVLAYVTNLNRHAAYKNFRTHRAEQRKRNQTPCGHKLASLLLKYSIRGAAYTRDLQALIQRHGLKDYDRMVLQQVCLKP